jgi:hypothetical protein
VIVLKILDGTLKLADSFFLMHPDIRIRSSSGLRYVRSCTRFTGA